VRHSLHLPSLQKGVVAAHWMSELQLASTMQRSSLQVYPQTSTQSGSLQMGFVGAYSGLVQLQRGDKQEFVRVEQALSEQSAPLSVQICVLRLQVFAGQSLTVRHLLVVPVL